MSKSNATNISVSVNVDLLESDSSSPEEEKLLISRNSSISYCEEQGQTERQDGGLPPEKFRFSFRKLWQFMGPGWLMSVAYLDPGNLEADLQSGAYGGNRLLWVILLSTVFGMLIQSLAIRCGLHSGKDLATLCSRHYSKPVAIILWIMMELAIIGADIQEVVGSAVALKILFGIPLAYGVILTAIDTFGFLLLHYYGLRRLEALFGAMLLTMAGCFCASFFKASQMFGQNTVSDGEPSIVEGLFFPTVPASLIMQVVGLVGSLIMPHNIYLHTALVNTRTISHRNSSQKKEAVVYNVIESCLALLFSLLINMAICLSFSYAFFNPQCAQIGTNAHLACLHWNDAHDQCLAPDLNLNSTLSGCEAVGIMNAGVALEEVVGRVGKVLWALGLLASGQASTMSGTLAGQFVMQGFLQMHVRPWKRLLLTRMIAIVPAMIVALVGAHSEHTLDILSQGVNFLQSVQLPFAVLPVFIFTNKAFAMGSGVNSRLINAVMALVIFIIFVLNGVFVVLSVASSSFVQTLLQPSFFPLLAFCILVVLSYVVFIVLLIAVEFFDKEEPLHFSESKDSLNPDNPKNVCPVFAQDPSLKLSKEAAFPLPSNPQKSKGTIQSSSAPTTPTFAPDNFSPHFPVIPLSTNPPDTPSPGSAPGAVVLPAPFALPRNRNVLCRLFLRQDFHA
eukprot:GCRY01000966.1.p1 GENE.GCRY01000966.1~~GCRY01000966.1.p1  ORF type:complete len:676 (-),score=109.87 GCRY01000966.1:321-2348(-)